MDMDVEYLKKRILYNCDVTDARHSGMYSVCGLVMRLRDLYKWEKGLPPWHEDESAKVLQWIGDKESLWEGLMRAPYRKLPINGRRVEAFASTAVNQCTVPLGLYYGAGYAHSLKPTFFLAEIDDCLTICGRKVWILGREHARDLLTLPAFSQDRQVVLRTAAGRMYLWDQILYISRSGRRALDFALLALGFQDHDLSTLQRRFDDIWNVQKDIYIRHEVGELEETVFNRNIWRRMLADYPHSAVELYIRTLKDLLADTSPKGPLAHLIAHRNKAGLGLYLAFGSGITRILTRALVCAFEAFTADSRWDRISEASAIVRAEVRDRTRKVVEIYKKASSRGDPEYARTSIEGLMRKSALIK